MRGGSAEGTVFLITMLVGISRRSGGEVEAGGGAEAPIISCSESEAGLAAPLTMMGGSAIHGHALLLGAFVSENF